MVYLPTKPNNDNPKQWQCKKKRKKGEKKLLKSQPQAQNEPTLWALTAKSGSTF